MLEKIPFSVRVAAIRFWFAGVAYFLVCWMFSLVAFDILTLLIVLGLVCGLAMAAANPVLRLMETPEHPIAPWLMFPGKGYGSFCATILYGATLTALTYGAFALINCAVTLTADPVLFGAIYLALDIAFLLLKKLFYGKKAKK